MGPPPNMWSVVDRNVVMRRIPVFKRDYRPLLQYTIKKYSAEIQIWL